MGVMLEISVKVEDAVWIKKKDIYKYISVAELDAVLNDINVSLR